MDSNLLSVIIGSALTFIMGIVSWLFISMINDLKKQIKDVKTETKAETTQLWASHEKLKDDHGVKFDTLTSSIHEMKEVVIGEIRKLELTVAKINTKN